MTGLTVPVAAGVLGGVPGWLGWIAVLGDTAFPTLGELGRFVDLRVVGAGADGTLLEFLVVGAA